MTTGNEFLDWIVQFATNEPELALILSVVGAIIVVFFINMIGEDKKS